MEGQRHQRRETIEARRIVRRWAGSREAFGAPWKEDTVREKRRSRRKVHDEVREQENGQRTWVDSHLQWRSKGTTHTR